MSEEQKPKRKTHTSTAVKNRYNKKTYTKFSVAVRKDIAEKYKSKCDELGMTYSQLIHETISNFIDD